MVAIFLKLDISPKKKLINIKCLFLAKILQFGYLALSLPATLAGSEVPFKDF